MSRVAVAAVLFAAALSACAPKEYYKATLNGTSEVPPTRSSGMGNALVTLDPNSNLLSWTVQYAGLTGPANGAHIHGPAVAGANAPVLVPFTNVDKSPITGAASLTNAQVEQLRTGRWYVNIHTAANPGGEIRGQLAP